MGPIRSAAAGSCRYACTARLFGKRPQPQCSFVLKVHACTTIVVCLHLDTSGTQARHSRGAVTLLILIACALHSPCHVFTLAWVCCKVAGVACACCIAAASVRPWNMPGQLQPLLSAWLDKQMSGFVVWVDRQLQQEDWKPLGLDQVRL